MHELPGTAVLGRCEALCESVSHRGWVCLHAGFTTCNRPGSRRWVRAMLLGISSCVRCVIRGCSVLLRDHRPAASRCRGSLAIKGARPGSFRLAVGAACVCLVSQGSLDCCNQSSTTPQCKLSEICW